MKFRLKLIFHRICELRTKIRAQNNPTDTSSPKYFKLFSTSTNPVVTTFITNECNARENVICRILVNKQHQIKVYYNSFHMNGHTPNVSFLNLKLGQYGVT